LVKLNQQAGIKNSSKTSNFKKHHDSIEMNDKAIKELINDNKHLFWYTPENKIDNLGEDQLVETILNYGDENAIRRLIEILGIDKVAQIFNKQISTSSRRKNNYHELVLNYFQLYFKRHAKGSTV
jgi:hypothetical protein